MKLIVQFFLVIAGLFIAGIAYVLGAKIETPSGWQKAIFWIALCIASGLIVLAIRVSDEFEDEK